MFTNAYVKEVYESEHVRTATKQLRAILDAKYEKSDLHNVMETQCQHLTMTQRNDLLKLSGYLVQNFNISKQTYVKKNNPWTVILAAAVFVICSTTNRQKVYSPGQLIFCRDTILLIKQGMDWEFIRQEKQTQIIRDNN